jgi:hypothetical protein
LRQVRDIYTPQPPQALTEGPSLAPPSANSTNGVVQVIDAVPIPAPSETLIQASTLAPSLVPSEGSILFSAAIPETEQFQWDIARVGTADLTFIEDSGNMEIVLSYNISRHETKIQVLEEDCLTQVPENVTSLTSDLVITTTTHGDLSVNVDIKLDAILDSAIWNDLSVGEGYISMCVRVDLLLGDAAETSVTFHEQKLFVTIDLLQGFEVTGIDLDRLDAEEEDGDAALNHTLSACQCDESFTCTPYVLTQGSNVYICVETTTPNLEIAEVRDLVLTQGAFNVTPVVDGVPDALSVVLINGKQASIRYQMISAFFRDPDPEDVIANGAVLLAFTDDSGRRQLHSVKLVPRVLVQKDEKDVFQVTMALASDGAYDLGSLTSAAVNVFVSGVVGVITTVIGAIIVAN